MPVSIIILTKNEELSLPGCLATLSWCDDIHVVDSGSTDQTVAIARRCGCQVQENPFLTFAQQRNWALDNCATKHDWVLFMDADEQSSPEFRRAVEEAVTNAQHEIAGYYCCFKVLMMGRWLKRSGYYPVWVFRVVRKGRGRFRDFGHGQKEGEIDGVLGYIKEPFLHYAFAKGWAEWVERHNRYSSQEARLRLEEGIPLRQVFHSKSTMRNIALRYWLTRLPGWPLLRFAHVYFFRLGFLDGYPGLVQSLNVSWYEYLIKLKMKELQRRARALPL